MMGDPGSYYSLAGSNPSPCKVLFPARAILTAWSILSSLLRLSDFQGPKYRLSRKICLPPLEKVLTTLLKILLTRLLKILLTIPVKKVVDIHIICMEVISFGVGASFQKGIDRFWCSPDLKSIEAPGTPDQHRKSAGFFNRVRCFTVFCRKRPSVLSSIRSRSKQETNLKECCIINVLAIMYVSTLSAFVLRMLFLRIEDVAIGFKTHTLKQSAKGIEQGCRHSVPSIQDRWWCCLFRRNRV